MTLAEMAKKRGLFGKSYAAVISTAPNSDEEFLNEWRQIGSALLQWQQHRKKEAETVMLNIVSDPANHAGFKVIIQNIYREEATLSPLLKSKHVIVALLNQRGQPVEQYQLGT